MNDLMTINTTELANKKLGTQINNIKKAIDTGNASQWKIADAIYTIISGELFVEDFENEKNLAEVLGMSRSNLNKMKNASEYHAEIEELKPFTLAKVMEMLIIPKDGVVDFLEGYEVTASDTVKSIREAVSAWKDDNVVADAELTDSESEVTDSEPEVTDSEPEVTDSEPEVTDNLTKAKAIVDKLTVEELAALMTYIESRV